MTDLYDALISDSWNRASPKVQAFAYAIQQGLQLAMDKVKGTLCLAGIDDLSEDALDQMAVDNRVMYYDELSDIEKKRAIIKRSLIWYGQAGTAAATKELLSMIFDGVTTLVECPEGEAYTFDIETDGLLTERILERLENLLSNAKNVRSHLRKIKRITNSNTNLYFAAITSEIQRRATSEAARWPAYLLDDDNVNLTDEEGNILFDGGNTL